MAALSLHPPSGRSPGSAPPDVLGTCFVPDVAGSFIPLLLCSVQHASDCVGDFQDLSQHLTPWISPSLLWVHIYWVSSLLYVS